MAAESGCEPTVGRLAAQYRLVGGLREVKQTARTGCADGCPCHLVMRVRVHLASGMIFRERYQEVRPSSSNDVVLRILSYPEALARPSRAPSIPHEREVLQEPDP